MNENEITILDKATGEELVILRADWNDYGPEKYKIIREPESKDDGTITAGGDAQAIVRGFTSQMEEVGKKLDGLAGAIEASADVSRKPVTRPDGTKRETEAERFPTPELDRKAGGVLRARPSWERQYDQLPEDERKYRTPETDVMCWRYLVAVNRKDIAVLREITDWDRNYHGDLKRIDADVQRIMNTTTGKGEELVPTPLSNILIQKRDKRERILPRAMRVSSVSDTLRVPQENATGSVVGVAESDRVSPPEMTPDPSTFTELLLVKKKAGRLVRVSWELTQDASAAFSMINILSDQYARKAAVYFDTQGAAAGDGTGTNHTLSIENATISTVVAGGAASYANVNTLYHGLDSAYRDGGSVAFMGNANVIEFWSGINGDNGQPIFQNSGSTSLPISDVGNAQGFMFGQPVVELPFTSDIGYFGDLMAGFMVLEEPGVRIDASTEAGDAFENDEVWYRFLERRDSAVSNAEAFVKTSLAVTAPA